MEPTNKLAINLVRIICVQSYNLYLATLSGNPTPRVEQMLVDMRNIQPGNLVFETSTIYRENQTDNFGIFKEVVETPIAQPGDEDYDLHMREYGYIPKRRIYVIETLDGYEVTWDNCEFLRVFDFIHKYS